MKYLIYARVSPRGSDYDGETSIQMQIDMCKRHIEAAGDEIVSVVYDEFHSGKSMDRPGMKQILLELRSDRAEWDAICFYKMSRLSRSQRDSVNFLAELSAHGKGFLSVTEKYDYSTPIGRAMLGVMQVINQLEREQTAENTRNKMISIAAKGLCPYGNPPHGYKRGDKGDNRLYIDPRRSEEVKDIFAMYISSKYSTQDIMRKYPSFSKNLILNILRNRTYLGEIVYAGQTYPGQHLPIIGIDIFNEVQGILQANTTARKIRPKAQKRPYLLAGLIRCHCGRFMSPASAKSGQYHYYECTDDLNCKNRIPAEKIEIEALNKIRAIKIDPKLTKAALIEIEQRKQNYIESLQPELARCREARTQAQKERESVINVMLSGHLSESNAPVFNTRLEVASKEVNRLNERIEALEAETHAPDRAVEQVVEFIKSIENLGQVLDMASDNPEKQRFILIARIEKIVEQSDGQFKFYFTYPTESSPNGDKWHPHGDSNPSCRDENPVS